MSGETGARREDSRVYSANIPISKLIELLGESVDDCQIDPPANPDGEWWVDVVIEGFSTNVAWRKGQGFGLFTTDDGGYGTGPDEIFREPALASKRLLQMAAASRQPGRGGQLRLKDVRNLMAKAQVAVAKHLHTDQAVISRLERQNDALLSTVRDYVEALGGSVMISIKFDDFVAPLEIAAPGNPRLKRRASQSSPQHPRRKVHA